MTTHTQATDTAQPFKQAKAASFLMAQLSTDQKNEALQVLSQLLLEQTPHLLEANQEDCTQATEQSLSTTMIQRLKWDAVKIKQLTQGILDMITLPDPVNQVLQRTLLDDGLVLEKLSVPLGVLGVIFEARPDALPQIAALALKSGNAVILKGGQEALRTNQSTMAVFKILSERCPFLPMGWIQLLTSREDAMAMLNYPEYIDLIIPRGSNQLVQMIQANTKIPVLGHADGICHIYVDSSADLEKALPIILDAKAQYPAACNAVETLLVHQDIPLSWWNILKTLTDKAGITLIGCSTSLAKLPGITAANETDWSTEYGDLRLSIKVVQDVDDAIQHILTYGSQHTDAILANDKATIAKFTGKLNSACVFINASTRFADGFRFGFGAEVGISTAKTHARGPVGLEGLTLYKYVLNGSGQIVQDYVGPEAKPFRHQAL
jgi:glutamate-5-semialdehyde dehydrogenase